LRRKSSISLDHPTHTCPCKKEDKDNAKTKGGGAAREGGVTFDCQKNVEKMVMLSKQLHTYREDSTQEEFALMDLFLKRN